MKRKTDESHPTAIYATPLADYAAGMHLVQGVLLALLHRAKTGEGQQVSVSLYSSMLALQMQEGAAWMMREKKLNWGAFPLTGCFATTDGEIVMVGAFKQNPLRDICEALEIEDLSLKPEFADFDRQMANRPLLQEIFRENFARKFQCSLVEAAGGRRYSLRAGAHAGRGAGGRADRINGMLLEAGETPAGPVRLVGSPIQLSAAPVTVRIPPPTLGQHNEEFFPSSDLSLTGDAA